jgi:hypothetical protein
MSALSDYAENKLLDHLLGKTSFTMPASVRVALFTAAPSDAGGGTEVSGGSYARQAIVVNSSSGGATNPNADVTFPVASASWGTVTHVGIFDAASGGNLLMWGALSASKTIASGDQLVFPAADLDFALA